MARSDTPPLANLDPPLAPPLAPRQHRLLQLLREARRQLTGQELHQLLTAAQERQGLVRCRKLGNGESVYAPLERDQHHLICVRCGRSERLPICPLGTSGLGLTSVLLEGFQPLFHTFEIHGLCSSCQHLEAPRHG